MHSFHANKAQFSNQHASVVVRGFFSTIVDNPIGKELTPTVNATSLTNLKVLLRVGYDNQQNKYGKLFQNTPNEFSKIEDEEIQTFTAVRLSKI